MEDRKNNNNIIDNYEILFPLSDDEHIFLVRKKDTTEIYVQKIREAKRNLSIIQALQESPKKGIPIIYEYGISGDCLIVIEEYVHGSSLEDIIKKEGKMDEETVLKYMMDLCKIVNSLHQMHPPTIHRDIKPVNIILSNDGVIKLIDFDAARNVQPGQMKDTTVMGTEHFAAPENYGFGQSDRGTDVYSLGATLNYLLSGKYIDEEICRGSCEEVIRKCTMINKRDRYESVMELEHALSEINDRKYRKTFRKKIARNNRSMEAMNDEKTFNQQDEVLTDQNKEVKDESITSFLPPGFRSKTWWKMIVASLVYFLFFMMICRMEIKNSGGIVLIGPIVIFEKVSLIATFIFAIAVIFNYRGIHRLIPFRNNKILKWIMASIYIRFLVFFSIMME